MANWVLVTGAYGFIGRYVTRCYASKGWKVIGLGHGSWAIETYQPWGIHAWYGADVTLSALRSIREQIQVIVHCAGSSSVGPSFDEPAEDFRRNVDTMLSVLEFGRLHCRSARTILVSSAAVYGAAATIPIPTSASLRPMSPYGVHKQLCEELCQEYGRFFGMAVVIVRLFSVYGPGLRKQLLWDACRKMLAGDLLFQGTGEEMRDWLYVEDAADLLFLAHKAADSSCRVLNGGSGRDSSVRETIQTLANALGVTEIPRFTGRTRRGDPKRFLADITTSIELGWRPKWSLRQGVEAYASWYLESEQ